MKTFGTKLDVTYYDRPGAYIIPIEDGKIGIVKLPKGLFLLGGKIEKGESEKQCIRRECLEEIGYEVEVGEKIAEAETYGSHSELGHFHPIHYYYSAKLIKQVTKPIEKDHTLCWLTYEEIKGKMFSEMQNWAIDVAVGAVKSCC